MKPRFCNDSTNRLREDAVDLGLEPRHPIQKERSPTRPCRRTPTRVLDKHHRHFETTDVKSSKSQVASVDCGTRLQVEFDVLRVEETDGLRLRERTRREHTREDAEAWLQDLDHVNHCLPTISTVGNLRFLFRDARNFDEGPLNEICKRQRVPELHSTNDIVAGSDKAVADQDLEEIVVKRVASPPRIVLPTCIIRPQNRIFGMRFPCRPRIVKPVLDCRLTEKVSLFVDVVRLAGNEDLVTGELRTYPWKPSQLLASRRKCQIVRFVKVLLEYRRVPSPDQRITAQVAGWSGVLLGNDKFGEETVAGRAVRLV